MKSGSGKDPLRDNPNTSRQSCKKEGAIILKRMMSLSICVTITMSVQVFLSLVTRAAQPHIQIGCSESTMQYRLARVPAVNDLPPEGCSSVNGADSHREFGPA